jgi:hypothetical protein
MSKQHEQELEAEEPLTNAQETPTVIVDESAEDDKDVVETKTPGKLTRRERYQAEREERRKREEERFSALEERIAKLTDVLYRNPTAQPAYQPHQAAPAPQAGDLATIDSQRKLILKRMATPGVSDKESEWLESEFHRLDAERVRAIARELIPQQSAPQLSKADIGRTILEQEYPDIYENKHATEATRQEYMILLAQGAPDNLATARQACKNIQGRLGGGGEASASTKSKYTGVSSRPGAGTPGGPKKVALSRDQMKMAREWSKGRAKDDNQAAEIYVREVLVPNGLV